MAGMCHNGHGARIANYNLKGARVSVKGAYLIDPGRPSLLAVRASVAEELFYGRSTKPPNCSHADYLRFRTLAVD